MRYWGKIGWIACFTGTLSVFNIVMFYMSCKLYDADESFGRSMQRSYSDINQLPHLEEAWKKSQLIPNTTERKSKSSSHLRTTEFPRSPVPTKRKIAVPTRNKTAVPTTKDVDTHLPTFHSHVIAGRPREDQAYLVIGIPSAHRKKAQYLIDSIRDLVHGLNKSEKQEVIIVVFATDFEAELRGAVVDSVARNFRNELESGLIHVIEAPAKDYPPLTNLPPLWNDKPDRIRWRSKQCIDYAILFRYCSELGGFYLQLEDDISVDPGYLKVMKAFIEKNEKKIWSVLEFGARGFIGMLYRASSLKQLSRFVQMYYWIWPVDILFRHFNDINLHGNPSFARLQKPLFRHVGSYSTLDGQLRKNHDVEAVGRLHVSANNPPAQVTTTITEYTGASIADTYSTSNHGSFWGKNLKVQDNVTIIFVKPESVSQVVIETGGHGAAHDTIGEATLFRSSEKEGRECRNFKEWRRFTNVAKLTARVSNEQKEMSVNCLRLTLTKLQYNKKGNARWLKIREIAVWTTSYNYGTSNSTLH